LPACYLGKQSMTEFDQALPRNGAMNDERTLLDKRIAWLEYQVVRLVWGVIALASLLVGYVAYTATVDYLHLGRWVALGVAVAAWLIAGWWLERTEFKGAPGHINYIDPWRPFWWPDKPF